MQRRKLILGENKIYAGIPKIHLGEKNMARILENGKVKKKIHLGQKIDISKTY